ncbi:conserved hypothetical protein [Gloeothece citriformis PCC 7424]|uniref:Lipoprotein n=1 Tax=Gloeothece citriformis (strain PCC 7424) TaxID=65393 RepID=B7KJS7_GLOC7|nr:hypothetical protein [Gloeothece citriformis]ACK69526.1 conserved hypothetical protein [Gloeothece citriformis PCC 7424]
MKIRQNFSLYRILTVFVAGLFLFVLTACGSGTPKVLANDSMSTRSNKPANVMQPSDIQQRQGAVPEANRKAQILVEQSKRNLEEHGNYQQSNNPFNPEKSASEIAGDLQNKLGEGAESLKEGVKNSAQDFTSATKSAGRSAKILGEDLSNKAQRTGDEVQRRTFDND